MLSSTHNPVLPLPSPASFPAPNQKFPDSFYKRQTAPASFRTEPTFVPGAVFVFQSTPPRSFPPFPNPVLSTSGIWPEALPPVDCIGQMFVLPFPGFESAWKVSAGYAPFPESTLPWFSPPRLLKAALFVPVNVSVL